MVHALHLQRIQRFLHIGGRSFFARVGHPPQSQVGGGAEHLGEFRRGMTQFRGVQPHGANRVQMGGGLLQGGKGVRLAKVPHETQDQPS